MTGVRFDVENFLSASDSFLFPSLWEGLPVSVVEAQASGIPCILSKNITSEVQITNLVTWMDVSEADEIWADVCYEKAVKSKNGRVSPISEISNGGYNIDLSAKSLCEFYIEKSKNK